MGSRRKIGRADGRRTVERSNLDDAPELPAGSFSRWLRELHDALRGRTGGTEVPCGECTACCHFHFVHIRPEETQTKKHVPRALLFPAPGLPEGNVLMGYNQRGECPMLVQGACSIYPYRPRTCREYDCRIFAATGIWPGGESQAEIAQRARRWRFEYPEEIDRTEQAAVRAAAAFLTEKRSCFPERFLPGNPAQLAVLAVRVHPLFLENAESSKVAGRTPSDAETARAVMAFLQGRAGSAPTPAARQGDERS